MYGRNARMASLSYGFARLLDASDKIADLERFEAVIVIKACYRDENVLVLCHAKHSFLL